MHILYNAQVHTLDPKNPQASAIVVDGERILALGDSAEMRQQFGGKAHSQDMGGATILPGLIDAHLHLQHYALFLQMVDCETPTRAECLLRVAERVRQLPPGEWLLGHGWNQNLWPEGFGCAADLDVVAPNHPVFLTAKSLHAAWANTAALRLAGISALTPDPQGGRIGRHPQGHPDGILFESAVGLVSQVIPESTPEQVAQAIHAAQPVLWRMGLTGVHDFDRRSCFMALQILHQRGDLRLRVLKSIPLELLPQAVELGLRSGFGDDLLRIGHVKAFMDGALGPQTAAMFQPYEGSQEDRGMLFMDSEELLDHGRQALECGLPLAVHAIGDRANHETLLAISRLRQLEAARFPAQPPLRHRIEHVQVLYPADVGTLASLGVIASMQPIHAPSDMGMADRFWGSRATLSYAWQTQLQHGAVLAFGSDAPVESPNPFWGLHAAVTRQDAAGNPPQGWHPEQRLSLLQALHAFTRGPAYAAGMENRLGQLAPSFYADLLVLERDPFTCPPGELRGLQPRSVMVNGEWVIQA